jgi:hypothetical protein
MKTKGIFRIIAAPILALLSFVKSVPYSHDDAATSYGGGRQAFYGVSGPRTRAMRRRHPL